MNIYLAARYSRYPEMQHYARELRQYGHKITSRWILGDHDLRASGHSDSPYYAALWAQEDWDDLLPRPP